MREKLGLRKPGKARTTAEAKTVAPFSFQGADTSSLQKRAGGADQVSLCPQVPLQGPWSPLALLPGLGNLKFSLPPPPTPFNGVLSRVQAGRRWQL